MKTFFNKIYYAFSKAERWINLTNRKGDFSRGKILEIITGFELGITFLFTSFPTYFFVRDYLDYIIIIPISMFVGFLYFTRKYVKKYVWNEPDMSLWNQFDDTLVITKWIIIGIITAFCSFICVIGGGIIFVLTLFQIYNR